MSIFELNTKSNNGPCCRCWFDFSVCLCVCVNRLFIHQNSIKIIQENILFYLLKSITFLNFQSNAYNDNHTDVHEIDINK